MVRVLRAIIKKSIDLRQINRNTILYMSILPEFKSYRDDKSVEACRGFVKLYLFIIALMSLVLVVVVVGGIWLKGQSGEVSDKSSDGVQSTIGRTAGFQREQLEKNRTYAGYVSLFGQLLIDYQIAPSDERKKELDDLVDEAKRSFSQEFNKADFIIPCTDEKTCISGLEDEEVVVLISAIKSSAADRYLIDAAVKSLVSLGSYEFLEETRLVGPYNQAYSYAVSVLDMDKSNKELEEAIVNFERIISQKLPTKFQFYKDQGIYKLTNEDVSAQ